jgi:hypothetical protein
LDALFLTLDLADMETSQADGGNLFPRVPKSSELHGVPLFASK